MLKVVVILTTLWLSCSLNSNERKSILNFHNEVRRRLGATGMIELSYDKKLEDCAQNYLQKLSGPFVHNSNAEQDYSRMGGSGTVGENYYTGDVKGATNSWVDDKSSGCAEKDAYDGKCNGEYEHYIQVIWSTTARVGCGFIPNKGTLCYYSPAGNVIGESPYTRGKPCSECPSGSKCSSGLCSFGSMGDVLDNNGPNPQPQGNSGNPSGQNQQQQQHNQQQQQQNNQQPQQHHHYYHNNHDPDLVDVAAYALLHDHHHHHHHHDHYGHDHHHDHDYDHDWNNWGYNQDGNNGGDANNGGNSDWWGGYDSNSGDSVPTPDSNSGLSDVFGSWGDSSNSGSGSGIGDLFNSVGDATNTAADAASAASTASDIAGASSGLGDLFGSMLDATSTASDAASAASSVADAASSASDLADAASGLGEAASGLGDLFGSMMDLMKEMPENGGKAPENANAPKKRNSK